MLNALSDLGIKHGMVSSEDIQAAVSEHHLQGSSAKAVALANEKRFGSKIRIDYEN